MSQLRQTAKPAERANALKDSKHGRRESWLPCYLSGFTVNKQMVSHITRDEKEETEVPRTNACSGTSVEGTSLKKAREQHVYPGNVMRRCSMLPRRCVFVIVGERVCEGIKALCGSGDLRMFVRCSSQ